jgi:hypothetical protein
MQKASPKQAFAATVAGFVVASAGGPAAAAPVDRWQWLDDTYWYVPAAYLPAVASNPTLASPLPVSDQTVYHIVHYAGGYFWGPTAVSYTPVRGSRANRPTCLQLVGSVTPEGRVHLTFTLVSEPSKPPTVGLGTMTRQGAAWTMENQMSTVADDNIVLTHWAYMFQCKPADPCFAELPGIGSSIPAFLAPCEKALSGRP